MVAREVHSLEVAGSNPASATNLVLRREAKGLVRKGDPNAVFSRMSREAIITSSRLNCYGTRVLTDGVDCEQYLKNPILLYMHRRGSRADMPIGIIENIRIDGDFIYGTPKIDSDTDEEKIIAQKWERGTLRMLSAGIEIIELSDDPQYLVHGQTRPTVIRSKLVEVSVVDIGANDDALQSVKLYSDNKLLTLAKGEESTLLPLLKTSDPQADDAADDERTQTTKQFSMNKILQLLGLATNATEDDAVAAIQKLQSEIGTLSLARITDAVDAAIGEKRITADKKEHFIALGRSVGVDSLRETLSMFAPAAKPTDLIHESGKKMALAWDKCTPEQIADLRANDRAEYVRLYKEHYGFEPNFD